MKYLIGFIFGLSAAAFAAMAQDMTGHGVNAARPDITQVGSSLSIPYETHINAGVGPDGKMAPIKVDADGYVICSKIQP